MKSEVEDYQKTYFIYTKIHYFDNTFNPIENIYSFCIRNKNTKTPKHIQTGIKPIILRTKIKRIL